MAEYTQNYNLKKPAEDDFYNVKDFNDNADIIDAELKKAQEHRESTSNPHKVMADQVGAINPNLLINGDFQVWQRGDTDMAIKAGSGSYIPDRWHIGESKFDIKISKTANGLQISDNPNNGYITVTQRFEQSLIDFLTGKTVTASMSKNNIIYKKTFIWTSDRTAFGTTDIFGYDGRIEQGDALNWCKLEIGSVATDFSPRPYAEELAMCQRYFQRKNSAKQPYNTIGQCFIHYNNVFALIHLPVKLRTVPTCTQKGVLCATADMEPEITIQSVNGISDDILKIYCSSEQSFTENCLFELRANNDVNGDIWIDAEIY